MLYLLTKCAREGQRQRLFYNTGSFGAYAVEEDTKKEGLITVLISMSSNVSGRKKKYSVDVSMLM